jgi:dihydroorotase
VIFNLGTPRRIDPATFRSKSKNSPFKGRLLQGKVLRTIVGGKTVFSEDPR